MTVIDAPRFSDEAIEEWHYDQECELEAAGFYADFFDDDLCKLCGRPLTIDFHDEWDETSVDCRRVA